MQVPVFTYSRYARKKGKSRKAKANMHSTYDGKETREFKIAKATVRDYYNRSDKIKDLIKSQCNKSISKVDL